MLRMTTERRWEEDNWTVLWCNTVDEIMEVVNDKEFIWPLIFRGVKWLMDNRRTSSMILECKLIDGRETVWISISDEDVDSTLDKMMQFRIEREEYEECAVVRDLISLWSDWRNAPASSQLEV
jgi:hypothetical protein